MHEPRATPTAREPEEERSLPAAQAKYDQIFQTLHERIESGTYRFLELLPSENALAEKFGCTRNTVRKALALLVTQGHVQTMQRRGVQVISRPRATSTFLVGGIESLQEAAERNRISLSTHMISLEEGVVDAETAEASGMAEGAEIIRVKRLRVLDNVPLIVDTSYFLASVVPRLTRQIVESSVYAHLEEVLGARVASATRRITVERATEEDQRLIHLGEWIASSWSPRQPSTRRVCSSSTRARAIHRSTSPSRTPPTGCRQSAEAGPANLETQLVGSEPSSFGGNKYWWTGSPARARWNHLCSVEVWLLNQTWSTPRDAM